MSHFPWGVGGVGGGGDQWKLTEGAADLEELGQSYDPLYTPGSLPSAPISPRKDNTHLLSVSFQKSVFPAPGTGKHVAASRQYMPDE